MGLTKRQTFRAEWEVSSEELCVLASWFLSPMGKNSVLEELRVRRLAAVVSSTLCCFCLVRLSRALNKT